MSRREREPGADPLDADEPISKSERKRRANRLQSLGQRLAEMRPEELAALELPDALIAAIVDYQRFPSREAKRRQLQYIGRVMRDIDIEPLQAALERLDGDSAEERYAFHQLERWRERLLTEPEALTELIREHPELDVQQLRHHIQQVHKARDEERQRSASRALFRLLRDGIHPARVPPTVT
ncbi:MAG TPA: ribosome biogenesis factor YjgA [Pseudomonadales bacterium]